MIGKRIGEVADRLVHRKTSETLTEEAFFAEVRELRRLARQAMELEARSPSEAVVIPLAGRVQAGPTKSPTPKSPSPGGNAA